MKLARSLYYLSFLYFSSTNWKCLVSLIKFWPGPNERKCDSASWFERGWPHTTGSSHMHWACLGTKVRVQRPSWCQEADLTSFLTCCQARHSPASVVIPLYIGTLPVHRRPLLFWERQKEKCQQKTCRGWQMCSSHEQTQGPACELHRMEKFSMNLGKRRTWMLTVSLAWN
jgi:hypothetical protein